jgi:hypothetical protein
VGASPSGTTITFDCTGDAATACLMSVFQVTGYKTSVNPIAQKLIGGQGTGNSPVFTLPQNMDTKNGYIYQVINGNQWSVTQPSGWTEDFEDVSGSIFAVGYETAHRINGETGNTISLSLSGNAPTQFMFVEILSGSVLHNLLLLGVGN